MFLEYLSDGFGVAQVDPVEARRHNHKGSAQLGVGMARVYLWKTGMTMQAANIHAGLVGLKGTTMTGMSILRACSWRQARGAKPAASRRAAPVERGAEATALFKVG